MHYLVYIIALFFTMDSLVIFDFNKNSDARKWIIVDDVVMGGRSSGSFKMNDEGHGVFSGEVSLENNGGFSSLRYRLGEALIQNRSKVILTIKGDGSTYQFRVKARSRDYYSYISSFSTSGEWEEIEIPLQDMYPSFRGRRLKMQNFKSNQIEEIRFLIGNKRPERFQLLIDKIELK